MVAFLRLAVGSAFSPRDYHFVKVDFTQQYLLGKTTTIFKIMSLKLGGFFFLIIFPT